MISARIVCTVIHVYITKEQFFQRKQRKGAKKCFAKKEFGHLKKVIGVNITKGKQMNQMKIKLDEGAYMPVRGHAEDAGLDIRTPKQIVIYPGQSAVIDTGVHMQIPLGYFGKLESKSGLNVNHGIVSLGGIIDSGFTGSIVVKLYNLGNEKYIFEQGDKIIQLIIQPCLLPTLELVDELEDTERGNSGFGSTGR